MIDFSPLLLQYCVRVYHCEQWRNYVVSTRRQVSLDPPSCWVFLKSLGQPSVIAVEINVAFVVDRQTVGEGKRWKTQSCMLIC